MIPKEIRVQRIVGMAEEALIEAISDEEALLKAETEDQYWEETEVISHYKIVENYA